MEEGRAARYCRGHAEGAVISPFLANVYFHYVYDLWVNAWRKRHASGHMIVVRYADDTVAGFQHCQEAFAFLTDLKARLAKFALELHPEKTRLIEFGRFAAERRQAVERKARYLRLPRLHAYLWKKRDGKGFQLTAQDET